MRVYKRPRSVGAAEYVMPQTAPCLATAMAADVTPRRAPASVPAAVTPQPTPPASVLLAVMPQPAPLASFFPEVTPQPTPPASAPAVVVAAPLIAAPALAAAAASQPSNQHPSPFLAEKEGLTCETFVGEPRPSGDLIPVYREEDDSRCLFGCDMCRKPGVYRERNGSSCSLM